MDKIKFSTKYRTSKKGSRIVCIFQHYHNEDFRNQEFSPVKADIPFKNIIKIKTKHDEIKWKPYMDMTVEEVFEIAVELQNWEILPYSPIETVELPPVYVTDWFKGDEKCIEDFFSKYPNGIICERNTFRECTKEEWENNN